jgi:hypothetical protein
MDPQTFDRLARLLSMPRSRRTTWHALLGLALSAGATLGVGGSVRSAPKGRPGETCEDGTSCPGDTCCGRTCCPGRCFVEGETGAPFCCTEPEFVICGNPRTRVRAERQVCCPAGGTNPCICAGSGAIAGTYRRR